MDVFHNTLGKFPESESFKHHKTLFTLKSIREVCGKGEEIEKSPENNLKLKPE